MRCSIIMPLYNKAPFVSEAIESILQQSHQDFEIIVIDDGSSDDGLNRVKAFNDTRIKTFSQTNQGVSVARNTGIDKSSGELICFLDADDWYFPTYLRTLVSMAENFPDDSFFATHYQLMTHCDHSKRQDPLFEPAKLIIIDNLYARLRNAKGIFVTNSVCIRRSALAGFSPYFPPGEQWGEDQDLWFRLSEKFRLIYNPETLVAYRMDVANSLCASFQLKELMPYCTRIKSRVQQKKMPKRLRFDALRFVAEIQITLVRRLLMQGQRYAAFCTLITAWYGMLSKRWWISLFMCLLISPNMMERWETWRIQRLKQW